MRKILVTGATGKVGRHFIERVLQSDELPGVKIRALCHNRLLPPHARLEVVQAAFAIVVSRAKRWTLSLMCCTALPARKLRTTLSTLA